MKNILAWSGLLGLTLTGVAAGQTKTLTIAAGENDRTNTPVTVALTVPTAVAEAPVTLTGPGGLKLTGQLTPPGLRAEPLVAGAGETVVELHFVLPTLAKGESLTLTVTFGGEPPAGDAFAWVEQPGVSIDLNHGDRPVARYMCAPLDPAKRTETYKVFHHVFAPDGSRLVSKGPGGQYTHHRGIFYGFNKVTYGGNKQVDIWHCSRDTHQAHGGILKAAAGPVLARQLARVEWRGVGAELFAVEERELTFWNLPGGTLIDFASRVISQGGLVKVDGDPQHAGFHFRAAAEVEKTANETIYIRPDMVEKPGATRNWDAKKPDEEINFPWKAMSFVIDEKRYTMAYLDSPTNPKPARFSERNYGRFGSYFVAEFDEQKPLVVNYRLRLTDGEATQASVAAASADFIAPPKVEVR